MTMRDTIRRHAALAILSAAGLLLAAGTGLASAGEEEAAGGEEKKVQVDFDAAAYGQVLYVEGSKDKLLENEGEEMQSGFLLDYLRLQEKYRNGTMLQMDLGFLIPDRPKLTSGDLFVKYRKPGLWSLSASFSKHESFYDDAIADEDLASTFFPFRADLGEDIHKARYGASLAFAATPGSATSLRLGVDYLGVMGSETPLFGSPYPSAAGTLFAYPGMNEMENHRLRLRWEANQWLGTLLGLRLRGDYTLFFLDETFTNWQLDGIAFAGTNVYGKSATNHSIKNEARIDLSPLDNLTIYAAYNFAYGKTSPGFSYSMENMFRLASTGGQSFSVFHQTVPLTIDYRPIPSLSMRLLAAGWFSGNKVDLEHDRLAGDPEILTGKRNALSETSAKSLRQRFEIVFKGVPLTTLKLRQTFHITEYNFYRLILDLFPDAVDETRFVDAYRNYYGFTLEPSVRSNVVPGRLTLDFKYTLSMNWNYETVQELDDWMPYGDKRDWRMDYEARVHLKATKKLSFFGSFRYQTGRVWRLDETDLYEDADLDLHTYRTVLGLHALPARWMSLILHYGFNEGDYEIGSFSFPVGGRIKFRGTTHEVSAALGLNPIDWMSIDGGYSFAFVTGDLETLLHRATVDMRFKVHKNVQLGAGYLGRIFENHEADNFDYSGHLVRVMVRGYF